MGSTTRRRAPPRDALRAALRAAAPTLAAITACAPARAPESAPASRADAAEISEEVVRALPKNTGPVALDAEVFGAAPEPAPWPLRIEGLGGGAWEGSVDPLHDGWGIGRPAASKVRIDLSVIGRSADRARIAFAWSDGGKWRPAFADRASDATYRVSLQGEASYQWFDWPAIRPGASELVAWAVGARGSYLYQWVERDGALVETGATGDGFEKFFPVWSPDGKTCLTRAIRIRANDHDECLLSGGAVAIDARRMGFPTYRPAGGWACDFARGGRAYVRLSGGRELGPYDDADRPRATATGFEFAARRGDSLLRVRVALAAD